MAQETKQQEKLPVLADDVIEKRLNDELLDRARACHSILIPALLTSVANFIAGRVRCDESTH